DARLPRGRGRERGRRAVPRAGRVAVSAAVVGIAAVLVAGYAAAGPAGLIDAAALAAVGILVVARGTIPGGTARPGWPANARPEGRRGPPSGFSSWLGERYRGAQHGSFGQNISGGTGSRGRRSGRRIFPPTPNSPRTWSGRRCRGGTTSTRSARRWP